MKTKCYPVLLYPRSTKVEHSADNRKTKERYLPRIPIKSARSIMDNILGYELSDGGSIPSGRTKYYGVVSVSVRTTDCDSVRMGSTPIRLPRN